MSKIKAIPSTPSLECALEPLPALSTCPSIEHEIAAEADTVRGIVSSTEITKRERPVKG